MSRFSNMKLKFLIIPIIIITVCVTLIFSFETNRQYKSVADSVNVTMASIIGKIKEEYPDIDISEIIKILNSNKNSSEFQYEENGKQELLKYGINTDEINSIVAVQNQMNKNIIINIFLIIGFSFLCVVTILLYLSRRDKKLKEITSYIYEISNKNYQLDIDDNSEDELSNLKNELYKITVMLKEESENSKKDKENLKISVQDISHQLKTPLTSISIMLDNIKENSNMEEKTKQRFIFEISKQIEWINWLVVSLLKLSKLDADVATFNSQIINVSMLVNDIIKSLEIPIEIKNQNIIVEGLKDVTFNGDYKWQKEAITNIIKNCIEHNKDNASIFVSFEENSLYTRISIRDEGEGISKDELRHIFERFYKGKNSCENSVGIGLALAKSIVEKDGGMITCMSEVGVGTEFVVKYMKCSTVK